MKADSDDGPRRQGLIQSLFTRAMPVGVILIWVATTAGALLDIGALYSVAGAVAASIAVAALVTGNAPVVLAFLAVAALVLAWLHGDYIAVFDGLVRAAGFVAFLAALYILRGIVQTAPALPVVQAGLDGLPRRSQRGAVQLIGVTFAVPLAIGAVGVIGPLVSRIKDLSTREDLADYALRGMGLAVLFSPFTVAMGTMLNALDERVALTSLMLTGVVAAAILLALPHLFGICTLPRQLSPGFWRATFAVLTPIFLLIVAVLVLLNMTTFTALQSIALLVPSVALLVALRRGRSPGLQIAGTAMTGWRNMSGEVTIFVVAMVFATALSAHPAVASVVATLADWVGPGLLVGITVFGIAMGAMVGVHMIVTATVCLTAFEPHMPSLAHLILLGMAGLTGWAFGAMLAPGSPAFLLATRILRVSVQRMAFGPNLRFMIGFMAALSVAAVII